MKIDYKLIPFQLDEQISFLVSYALPKIRTLTLEKGEFIALSALDSGKQVGLALAFVYNKNKGAQLYSLFVREDYRGRGIGRELFENMVNELKNGKKVHLIGIEYLEEPLFAPLIEKILYRSGWPSPKIYLLRCCFDGFAFDPNWWHYPAHLPKEIAFFSWKDLTEKDRQSIDRLKEEGAIAGPLWPFHEVEKIDLPTSVGLRKGDEIIGWNITHRVDLETVRYSILFLKKEYHATGLGIQILVESLLRQKTFLIDNPPLRYAFFELHLSQIPATWMRFVERRLVPHTVKVERMKWGVKFLPENFL